MLCIRDMPSSFKAYTGKIVYLLEANLSRSMRMNKKDSTDLNFVSKVDMTSDPELMVSAELHLYHSCHSNRKKICVG